MRHEGNGAALPWFAGYALLWAARLTCIFNYPLFHIAVSGPSANNFLNMSMQITYLATVLVLGGLAARSTRFANIQPVRSAGLAFVAGVAIAFFGAYSEGFGRALLLIAAGLLVGVGDALLSLMWGRYFVGGTLAAAKTQMPVCLAFGAAAYFVVVLLPRPVASIALLALPAISAASLRKGLAERLYGDEPPSREAGRQAAGKLAPSLLCVAVCALVFGLIGQVALTAPVEQGVEHILPPMGIAAAGFISCLLAFGIRAKVTFDTVYRGVFAIASIGLFLLPFLGENYSVAFNLFVIGAYYLMEIYYFYYAVEVVQSCRVPVYAVYGLSHGVLCAMTLLGIFLSVSVFSQSQYGTVQLVLIAFVSAYLLGMGLLIGIRRRAVAEAQRAAAAKGSAASDAPDAPAAFSREYGFSQRESEVLSFLVAGRTSTFIAEAISLSPSTVKGHIQSIYRKCGVHNRQELLDVFESWKSAR